VKPHAINFSSGLPLKKLDKKLERTILHSYRKVFMLEFLLKFTRTYLRLDSHRYC